MEIGVKDASNYFKGLLLLIRKDHKVTEIETSMMLRIGKQLGFEREFCDNAIQEILKNRFIEDSPPHFSSREIAKMFIKDGLAIAFSGRKMVYKEEKWLRSVVERNSLAHRWFVQELENAAAREERVDHLQVDTLTVAH